MRTIFVGVLFIAVTAFGSESKPSPKEKEFMEFMARDPFFAYYVAVSKLRPKEDKSKDLMFLAIRAREKYVSISKFWHSRAKLQVSKDLDPIHSRELDRARTTADLEKFKVKAIEEGINAYRSYYYDNWVNINEMIDDAAFKIKQEKRREKALNQLQKQSEPSHSK